MDPAGYIVKLKQWEVEDRQLAAARIPNPYDTYPDDRSKHWLRARSKLVIKDRVTVIVFNNKEFGWVTRGLRLNCVIFNFEKKELSISCM
jgi:hypothetical protein